MSEIVWWRVAFVDAVARLCRVPIKVGGVPFGAEARTETEAGEYVRHFTIHTNTIEGVWSQLKRQIVGVHHFVSDKHLSRYVAESEWRYNRRKVAEGVRADALIAGSAGRLTYKALIA